MTSPRQIKVIFASGGDTSVTPDAIQVDGMVSYTEGYTFDYQRPKAGSPLAKDINRIQQNGLFRDAFANIQQYQQFSAPDWYASTDYALYTKVHHTSGFYVSTIADNDATPGATQDWALQLIPICEDRDGNVVQFWPHESAVGAGTIKTARLASQGVDIGANSINVGAFASQSDEGLLAGNQIAIVASYGDYIFTDELSTNCGAIASFSSGAQIASCDTVGFVGVGLSGGTDNINASGNSGGLAVSEFNSLDSSSGVAGVASNAIDITFGVNSVVIASDNCDLTGDDESNTVKQSAILGSSHSSVQSDSTSRVVTASHGVLNDKDHTMVGGYNELGDAAISEAINWRLDSRTGVIDSQNIRVLRGNTEEVDPLTLTADAGGVAYWNQVKLALNSAAVFKGQVVAYSDTGDASCWEISGLIKVGATVGTTTLVGVPLITMLYQDVGAVTWGVTVQADIGNGILQTDVTGEAATNIKWQATYNITRTNT